MLLFGRDGLERDSVTSGDEGLLAKLAEGGYI
jgi:hypothetical protein